GRVGRQPSDRQILDVAGQRPAAEQLAADRVQPEALTGLVQLLGGVHRSSCGWAVARLIGSGSGGPWRRPLGGGCRTADTGRGPYPTCRRSSWPPRPASTPTSRTGWPPPRPAEGPAAAGWHHARPGDARRTARTTPTTPHAH